MDKTLSKLLQDTKRAIQYYDEQLLYEQGRCKHQKHIYAYAVGCAENNYTLCANCGLTDVSIPVNVPEDMKIEWVDDLDELDLKQSEFDYN